MKKTSINVFSCAADWFIGRKPIGRESIPVAEYNSEHDQSRFHGGVEFMWFLFVHVCCLNDHVP